MQMDKLEYKKFTGLEIRCLQCGKTIHRNRTPMNGCRHPIEKTAYRAIVVIPGTKKKRISKTLKSRIYVDAVKECLNFRSDVLNGTYQNNVLQENAKPQLVFDCIVKYLDFLEDLNVPEHKKKHNSGRYISSARSHFNTYIQFLESEKINTDLFKVTDVDSKHVGRYYAYLTDNTASNYTFNHRIKAMRALFKYLIETEKYKLENVFKEVKQKTEKGKDMIMTGDDFTALLNIISPENSIKKIGKNTRRNMYKSWLVDAYKLKAYTGRRDEEIFKMKWNMIYFKGDIPVYIKTPNQKVNRLKNLTSEEELDFIYVPIIEELELYLNEIGLKENKSKNAFIIAPEMKDRNTMVSQASKSFTFFWEKLDRGYDIKLKHLRSTYITANEIYSFRQGPKLRQHANFRVTDKHYIDGKEIAKFISNDRSEHRFVVFPK